MDRRTFLGGAAALTLAARRSWAADGPLVIEGETIADAQLYAAAKAEGVVNVYGTYPADDFAPMLDGFRGDTGLTLNYLRLPGQAMLPRVSAEFAAGKLEADYVDLTDLPSVDQIVKLGILTVPYKTRSFADIPDNIRDPDGRWYSIVRPVYCIGINTELVGEADEPKSWADMLQDKWAHKLAVPDIEAGGSAFTLFSFLHDVMGDDYWKRMAALKVRIYPTSAPLISNLVRGEVAMAWAGTSTVFQQKALGAPLKAIFPKEGTCSFSASGGISSKAKNLNAAKLWMEWITSKRGSQFVDNTASYGASSRAKPPTVDGVNFPPPDKVWNINLQRWISTRDEFMNEWKTLTES